MVNLTYVNHPVSGAITGDAQKFQSRIIANGTLDYDTLVAKVAANTKESESIIMGILNETGKVVKEALAIGNRIAMENRLRIEFGAQGSSFSEDAPWDASRNKITLNVILSSAIRDLAKDIVPINVLKPVTIQVLGVQDAETLEQNILTLGHTALLQGKNLKINKENPEEGVYLVKGESEYKLEVTDSTAGTIDANVEGVPADEGYRLEVRGRAGLGTNRMLVTAKVNGITVKVA